MLRIILRIVFFFFAHGTSLKLRGHYSFFCVHAMQHALLHARIKKTLWAHGDFFSAVSAMQQKTRWSIKFVLGAMGQNNRIYFVPLLPGQN